MPDFSQTIPLSPAQIVRYSRHVILPQVGLAGQEKLVSSSILIIGMGGLGSPVALYLAAAGVGTLGLADFDTVAEHNLQRQILHCTDRIGTSKVDSARAQLRALNPHIALHQHAEGITPENALSLLSSYDLIVDGSDNFPTRYLVNDAAFFADKPLIYGCIFQFEGQVSLFHPKAGGPCYRCLFPKMPAAGTVPNCEEAGVFGALCGVVGSLQAIEAIKYVVGIGQSLMGRLLVVDAFSMHFRTLNLKKDPSCPLCGSTPTLCKLEAKNYGFTCKEDAKDEARNNESREYPMKISVEQAKALLDTEHPPYLLDVRESFEIAICQIAGSLSIPAQQIPERFDALPKDQPILVYCHHGSRSLQVTRFLRTKGYKTVSSIAGGIDAWTQKVDPRMRRY